MEKDFLSFECPNCNRILLDTAIFNPSYLVKASCPYCGMPVRWAKGPLMLVLFGILSAGTGLYCIIHKVPLFGMESTITSAAIITGAALFLLGLLLSGFELIKPRNRRVETHTRLLYPNT